MKTYLLTAAGVIFLSVIVSLVIPEGKLNKSIVFVMRIACILVLLQPIAGVFKSKPTSSEGQLFDSAYICNVYTDNQSRQLEKLIESTFEEKTDCVVDVVCVEGNFTVKSVTVEVNSLSAGKIDSIYEYLMELGYINISVYAKSD